MVVGQPGLRGRSVQTPAASQSNPGDEPVHPLNQNLVDESALVWMLAICTALICLHVLTPIWPQSMEAGHHGVPGLHAQELDVESTQAQKNDAGIVVTPHPNMAVRTAKDQNMKGYLVIYDLVRFGRQLPGHRGCKC